MCSRQFSLLAIGAACSLLCFCSMSVLADHSVVVVTSREEFSAMRKEKASSLSRQLSSRNTQDQLQALRDLATDRQQAKFFEQQLIELATADEVAIREASIRAIAGAYGNEIAGPVEECLRNALGDGDPRVRVAAIYALGVSDAITKVTASRLAELLQDENGDVQFAILQFLSRCPDLRRQTFSEIVALLDSRVMRSRWLSVDYAEQSPLAWDAARLVVITDFTSDDESAVIIKQKAESSEDARLRFILCIALDARSIGREPTDFSSGFAVAAVQKAVHRNIVEEQKAIFSELHESPVKSETRLLLMLELSKASSTVGAAAARAVVCEEPDWMFARERLVMASRDESIREWLKMAICEWLSMEE